ncbi:MAG: SUMF1/EgtB/PvdO family nonheme iron enzyme [Deltaproteobacteria bacterium]|nr:SUMF1/EgtB/PvdO family nonheme iron enzyme [Deltaproteobacteria bacterium]
MKAVVVVVVLGCLSACGAGDASLIVDFVPPVGQQGLQEVQARLTLTNANGDHPKVTVRGLAEDVVVVGVDVPFPCTDTGCDASISVEAGSYDVVLVLSAVDRCGSRSDVIAFSGALEVDHWEVVPLELVPSDASFDADDDGVIDVLEAVGCGRFDVDEGMQPPRVCASGHEDCCKGVTPLEGAATSFAGGSTTLPYDLDDDGVTLATVSPFALDATEVTWGQLERCVAAGVCLADRPESAARLTLAAPIDRRLPVQGLAPVDAAVLCAFFGKRLPDDDAWDFAASDRAGVRARYPFDGGDVADSVGCDPEDPAPAARHRAAGRDCGFGPAPVASFSTSYAARGTGSPVAELAGNVAEWTLVRGAAGSDVDDADFDGIPDGITAVVLRGGGAAGFVQLLENDLPLVFEVGSESDRRALQGVTPEAGFRCAAEAAVVVVEEPACPAP